MKAYELTLVLGETASKDDKKLINLATKLVEEQKGKVLKHKVWGVRDLAYPIKKATKGGYITLEVNMEADKINKLDKQLKQNEKVLRYLLIKKEERKNTTRK